MLQRRPNILKDKAEAFAQRIMKLELYLKKQTSCPASISNQVLRSGTSVYANICESFNAESKHDFIHKLSVALKEADETKGWLTNIKSSYDVHQSATESLISDLDEIRFILIASIKTAKGITGTK